MRLKTLLNALCNDFIETVSAEDTGLFMNTNEDIFEIAMNGDIKQAIQDSF